MLWHCLSNSTNKSWNSETVILCTLVMIKHCLQYWWVQMDSDGLISVGGGRVRYQNIQQPPRIAEPRYARKSRIFEIYQNQSWPTEIDSPKSRHSIQLIGKLIATPSHVFLNWESTVFELYGNGSWMGLGWALTPMWQPCQTLSFRVYFAAQNITTI